MHRMDNNHNTMIILMVILLCSLMAAVGSLGLFMLLI